MRIAFAIALVHGFVFAEPYITDKWGNPTEPVTRSLCGAEHRVPVAEAPPLIQEFSRPVGRYEAFDPEPTGDGRAFYCTGTLISADNILLTNSHCRTSCENMRVRFNYWGDTETDVYACKRIIEAGNGGSTDYMFVELEGNPSEKYGYYPLSDETIKPKTQLMLIGHPLGGVMKADWNTECSFHREYSGKIRHRCDTSPGNSGSGILIPGTDADGNYTIEGTRIVGVHAFGTCSSSSSSTNSGPAIRYLSKLSTFIKNILNDHWDMI